MPLGIVSDEDYQKEITQTNGSANKEISSEPEAEIIPIEKGRGIGSTEVPNQVRKLIGETSVTNPSSAAAIASFLGISKSSVSAYSKGATSTRSYNKPEKDLLDHINNKKLKISKKASSKLIQALDKMDEDKLDDLNGKELASVAKDMSVIIKNFEPDSGQKITNNAPTIVFYAPKLTTEDKYDVITVNE